MDRNKLIQKEILKTIVDFNGSADDYEIIEKVESLLINKNIQAGEDVLRHNISLLGKDNKISINRYNFGYKLGDRIEMNPLGYEELAPFYKKAWKFFNNDLAKILSIIAIILSIVATIKSIYK